MKIKNFITISFLILTVIHSYGQTKQDSISTIKNVDKKTKVKQLEVPIYKLFPTENTWTMLKLDTRNGKISQVHYTITKDGYEGELIINSESLVWSEEEEINGRFNLYPTSNIFNFILLDQISGKTYKVQWNNEVDKRFIRRIY